MACAQGLSNVSLLQSQIDECKRSSQSLNNLAKNIIDINNRNRANQDKFNKDLYLWDRADNYFKNVLVKLRTRRNTMIAEANSAVGGDWRTRCGGVGNYDYHCQVGIFVERELDPQIVLWEGRYQKFQQTHPKPTFTPLPVPRFENTMVCQACTSCVDATNLNATGNINIPISQINECTVNLERKKQELLTAPPPPVAPPPQPPVAPPPAPVQPPTLTMPPVPPRFTHTGPLIPIVPPTSVVPSPTGGGSNVPAPVSPLPTGQTGDESAEQKEETTFNWMFIIFILIVYFAITGVILFVDFSNIFNDQANKK